MRLVAVFSVALVFGSVLARADGERVPVTGYSHFLSASDREDEVFENARADAYRKCVSKGMRAEPPTTLEDLFPSLTGKAHSSCKVSDPTFFNGPYRYYECFAWYKAVCVSSLPASAESRREDRSTSGDDGAGGAGGAGGGDGNDGAEGSAAY